jgi:hypothetical protein
MCSTIVVVLRPNLHLRPDTLRCTDTTIFIFDLQVTNTEIDPKVIGAVEHRQELIYELKSELDIATTLYMRTYDLDTQAFLSGSLEIVDTP